MRTKRGRFVSHPLTPCSTRTVLLHIEGYADHIVEPGIQMVVDVHFMGATPCQEEDVALTQGIKLAGIGEQVVRNQLSTAMKKIREYLLRYMPLIVIIYKVLSECMPM